MLEFDLRFGLDMPAGRGRYAALESLISVVRGGEHALHAVATKTMFKMGQSFPTKNRLQNAFKRRACNGCKFQEL